MKSSKIKEYEAMSVEDLRKEEKALKSELFKLRFQHALNGLDNPKKMEIVKKNIARVNTVKQRKRKIFSGKEVSYGKKFKKNKNR